MAASQLSPKDAHAQMVPPARGQRSLAEETATKRRVEGVKVDGSALKRRKSVLMGKGGGEAIG